MTKSIYNSFVWSFLEQGGVRVAALVVQVVLARLLSPSDFGVLAILLVFTNIADVVAQSGLGTALVQKKDLRKTDYATAFWLGLALGTAMAAVLFFAAPAVADFYSMEGLAEKLRVLSVVVLLNSISSIQRSVLQKKMDFRALFKANVLSVALSGALGIAGAVAGMGVWALVLQTVSQSLFTCVALLAFAPWRPSLGFDARSAGELYGYGWKVCLTGILGAAYTSVSELIIGKACPVADLGYYSQGRKWPNAAIHMVSTALQNVFLPAFSAIQDDAERLKATIRKFLVASSFAVVPVSALFAVVAEPVVALLLTETWLPCVPVFRFACLVNVVLMLQLVNLRAFMALGRSDLYLKLQAAKVLVGVAAVVAAAAATRDIYCVALCAMLSDFFNVIVIDLQPSKRVLGYGRAAQLRDIAPTLVLAFAAAAASWPASFLDLAYPAEIVVQTTVFLAVYLLGARAVKHEGLSFFGGALRSLNPKEGEGD